MNALPQLPPEGSPARREIEKTAVNITAREVRLNVTGLVSTLAMGFHAVTRSTDMGTVLADLAEQAVNLMAPVDDWEEAAMGAGWNWDEGGPHWYRNAPGASSFEPYQYARTAEEACGQSDIFDPYRWEVYECWAVSQSLGEDLAALGEKVDDDFAGLVVWARTTTGVSFAGDDLFLRVAQLIQQRIDSDGIDEEPDLEGASSTEAGRYAAKSAGKMLGPKP